MNDSAEERKNRFSGMRAYVSNKLKNESQENRTMENLVHRLDYFKLLLLPIL